MRFKTKLFAFIAHALMKAIVKTCRIRISGLDLFQEALHKGSSIISFWHGNMFIVPALLGPFAKQTQFVVCISGSRDADVLKAVIDNYPPSTCIRIGHQSRASALLEMIREVEKGGRTLLVTPDGPKGPRQVIKEGMLEVSRKTGAPILTLSWKSSSVFRLPTWDKFQIPRPFSQIKVIISHPTPEEIPSGLNAF